MREAAIGSDHGRRQLEHISEIDVLWITAGLGCDGDTIAMTAATQPSIEELVLGAIPWIPKVRLHNPFLSYENGEEFMQRFHQAAEGRVAPPLRHRVRTRRRGSLGRCRAPRPAARATRRDHPAPCRHVVRRPRMRDGARTLRAGCTRGRPMHRRPRRRPPKRTRRPSESGRESSRIWVRRERLASAATSFRTR